MSEQVDLRLDWADAETRERPQGDHYEPPAQELEGLIEQAPALEPESGVAYPEEFEWSHDRALAFEKALGRIQGLTASKLQSHLKELLAACRSREDVTERLDLTEAWLGDRLADWQVVTEVRPEAGAQSLAEDDAERAASFNAGLEAGSNALSLAGEVVELLRAGELDLVERLLEQVGSYLLEARDQLLAAHPEPTPTEPG